MLAEQMRTVAVTITFRVIYALNNSSVDFFLSEVLTAMSFFSQYAIPRLEIFCASYPHM